jgi:hypothetical protein
MSTVTVPIEPPDDPYELSYVSRVAREFGLQVSLRLPYPDDVHLHDTIGLLLLEVVYRRWQSRLRRWAKSEEAELGEMLDIGPEFLQKLVRKVGRDVGLHPDVWDDLCTNTDVPLLIASLSHTFFGSTLDYACPETIRRYL